MPLLLFLFGAGLVYLFATRGSAAALNEPPLILTLGDDRRIVYVQVGRRISLLVPPPPQGTSWVARAEALDQGKGETVLIQQDDTPAPNGTYLNFYARKVGQALMGAATVDAAGNVTSSVGMTVVITP